MKRRKTSTKKRKKPAKKENSNHDEEEEALESFLFGTDKTVEAPAKEALAWADDDSDADATAEPTLVPAWEDEDDGEVKVDIAGGHSRLRKLRKKEAEKTVDGNEYTERLRERHQKINSATDWASLDDRKRASDSEEDDDDNHFLRSTEAASHLKSALLPHELVNIARVKDANIKEPSKAVVQSVKFHPQGQLLMTAGMDKTLRFFQVDGVRNSKVQGIHISELPIHSAAFTPDGTQVVASGRRKYFFVYDVIKGALTRVPFIQGRDEKSLETFAISPNSNEISFMGNNGFVLQVDMRSKQLAGTMKMNGTFRAMSYNNDGSKLYTTGGDGEVYIWDARTRRCMSKFTDDGSLEGTAIASSHNGQFLATGSTSGVVNVYDTNTLTSARPQPLKAVMSLTTPVDHILFNHDAQMMLIASRRKKDSLKLVHLPTLTTFSNWPTQETPLHYVTAVDFSVSSGYLAIGNDRGKVLLYRMQHYGSV